MMYSHNARGNVQNYKKVENVHKYLFFPSRNKVFVRENYDNKKYILFLFFLLNRIFMFK